MSFYAPAGSNFSHSLLLQLFWIPCPSLGNIGFGLMTSPPLRLTGISFFHPLSSSPEGRASSPSAFSVPPHTFPPVIVSSLYDAESTSPSVSILFLEFQAFPLFYEGFSGGYFLRAFWDLHSHIQEEV